MLIVSLTTRKPADNERIGGMRLVELDRKWSFPIYYGPCMDVLDICSLLL